MATMSPWGRGEPQQGLAAGHVPGLARGDLAAVVVVEDLRGDAADLEGGLPGHAVVGGAGEIDVRGIDQVPRGSNELLSPRRRRTRAGSGRRAMARDGTVRNEFVGKPRY